MEASPDFRFGEVHLVRGRWLLKKGDFAAPHLAQAAESSRATPYGGYYPPEE